MEALAGEMEAIEADAKHATRMPLSRAKSMPDWRKKPNGFGESLIRLPNRLSTFSR